MTDIIPSIDDDTLELDYTVPALISHAGDRASERFWEFFVVTIRNLNTREAYPVFPHSAFRAVVTPASSVGAWKKSALQRDG